MGRVAEKKPWIHWDAFMDEQFWDMDDEIIDDDDDKWVLEARDAVEQKRGMSLIDLFLLMIL